ncbi:gamma-glutamyl kinase [Cognatishimia sp. MH4019]|uniref:gamma-glutamyl kinase n=1 Tax=Cognatishimia sp. MH4019 TaxID=2854030 RepID=UPI001CD78AB4|nr:gamma-glutamyl kinase [Cognatishimia sp. MH4019]
MLVFWKEKLAFLATPKTGSTAYQEALRERADIVVSDPTTLKHTTIQRYNRFFRPMFRVAGADDIETLAVMREPIEWLGSWYRFRSRPFLDGNPNSTAEISFDEFALAYCQGNRPSFAAVGSQARFLTGAKGADSVDHLFRYNDQDVLIAFLKERLQVDFALDRRNVSPKKELSLEPKTERKLRRKLSSEYDLWESLSN